MPGKVEPISTFKRFLTRGKDEDDVRLDAALRPVNFGEFIGQKKTVDNLKIYIEASKKRKDTLDHVLFSGPPGLGKTTLAHIVAKELGSNLRATSGPVVERAGDLAGILTNLQPRDVLFIDEIHRIPKIVEEYLYSAMEDFTISIMIDQGAHARSVTLDVPRFTLIGATTREGLLTAALRSRFGVFERLEPYPPEDLKRIVERSAKLLDVKVEDAAADLISRRSRGTPRITNRFLRRIRDVAQVKSKGVVTLDVAVEGLKMLDVDECGLDGMDRKILAVLVRHKGAAVGLKTIAVTVGEEEDTIEEVYEPYLIQCGFLQKTPRGRVATEQAYEHLGKKPPAGQGSLFTA